MTSEHDAVEFDEDVLEEELPHVDPESITAVVQGTDWTAETLVGQLEKGNIALNPRFQRRDVWKRPRKSRFIESLIVGLPVPQIVLAEAANSRGKFVVIDGKQRLLALQQYWGFGDSPNRGFGLGSLTIREDLLRTTISDLEEDFEEDYNALCNSPIRTVVIRNWRDSDFLHTVFLRLNTGSVSLSPQELRQALLPGPFSDWVDRAAGESSALRTLLSIDEPDSRMRDVEILARFIAFRFFGKTYPGRMKAFLDSTFEALNAGWSDRKADVKEAAVEFELGVQELTTIFEAGLARKPGSNQFNRAIFDALVFFHAKPSVRDACSTKAKKNALRKAYDGLFKKGAFARAIESDTAGTPNTRARFRIWAGELARVTGRRIPAPVIARNSSSGTKKTSSRKAPRKSSKRR